MDNIKNTIKKEIIIIEGKKKYVYDYPDQRKLRDKLSIGDISLIAQATGYKQGSVSNMLNGTRKMPEQVRDKIEKLIKLREEMESVLLNDKILNAG